MTLRASKPAFNVREKLTELGRRFGLKGSELAAVETVQEARDIVSVGRKNLVINGDFRVVERGTATVSVGSGAASGYQIHDRWRINNAGLDSLTADYSLQGGDISLGFRDSARLTCTAAESVGAGERFSFETRIEAKNTVFLGWGSSKAKPITISFWVKSNLPGKYGVHVRHHDPGNAYVFPYTINQSDVWEYKTYTVPGDPYGTTNDDTGIGFWLRFMLASGDVASSADEKWSTTDGGPNTTPGAVAWGSVIGHTWEIMGVQVEVGRNATEFEHRPYGEELHLCRRYFQKRSIREVQMHWVSPWTEYYGILQLDPPMRDTPSNRSFGFARATNYQPGGGGGNQGSSMASSGLGASCLKISSESSNNGYDHIYINSTDTGSYDIYISAEL